MYSDSTYYEIDPIVSGSVQIQKKNNPSLQELINEIDRIILADLSSTCSPLTSTTRAVNGRVSLQDQLINQQQDICSSCVVQLGIDPLLLAQIKGEHFQTDPLLLFCFPKPCSNCELKIGMFYP